MLSHIIGWSLENRFIVLLTAIVISVFGGLALKKINLDAFPDVTPIQVQINAVAPSLNPLEIEQQVTLPIERQLSGLPGLNNIRSISKFGFGQLILTFDDDVNIYLARQLTAEKLQQSNLPANLPMPSLGPLSTGLGEVFHYVVEGKDYSLEELTTIQDWIIKPRLSAVSGVAEINTWGGEKRQYQVIPQINKLVKYKIRLGEIIQSLQRNNINVGGGNIVQAGEYHLIHGLGTVSSIEEIENIPVTYREGIPIRISDVAQVMLGHEIRRGAVTINASGETVLGLGFMLKGENSYVVTKKLAAKVKDIQADLPMGVKIRVLYQRTDLTDAVILTVKENLFYGALLVVATLFWFMGSLRAGLIVALAIPLSMLFAFIEMVQFSIAGSLMSLGAIDFGLIVDSSVIVVENSMRKLQEGVKQKSRIEVVRQASIEVRKPTLFGELIILVVFLPILTLEGVEGKLFFPMALTMIFALAGSLIISMTLTPVLASYLLPMGKNHSETFLMRTARVIYQPVLQFAIRFKEVFIISGILLTGLGIYLGSKIGNEFIPRLSEGTIVINTVRLAGISLEESVRYGQRLEKLLLEKFPDEIKEVWTRTGTAQIATDPMGLELSDLFITLRPRNLWKKAKNQDELSIKIRDTLKNMPAMRTVLTQPIEMRVNEMTAGIRTDFGVKIFGDSFEILKEKATEISAILEEVSGSSDVYVEQITGQVVLEIKVRQDAIGRYGLSAEEVLKFIEGIGAIPIGEIREGQRRFDLVVRLEGKYRNQPEALGSLIIFTESGKMLPFDELVSFRQLDSPSTISREWQKRRITVQCNVVSKDLRGFVEAVKRRIRQEIEMPTGYHIELGGQFEHLERAEDRLKIIIPTSLFLILCLLFISTGRLSDSLIIFTGAPFAALGGITLLFLRDMPFTISAAVGFVAVSGVAMLNGLVLMSTIRQKIDSGLQVSEAVFQGAMIRFRPVIMTALVASAGFLPMAINTGVGAEIQRPLSTVVIGGVFSDCLLTLCILPALAVLFLRPNQTKL